MSWSVSFIGTPTAVAKALDSYADSWSAGQSKDEYDAAKPHIIALVQENVGGVGRVVQVTASGHATITDGVKTYGTCTASVTGLSGTLVTD